MKSLCEEFKCLEGQPVKIYTDDGKTHTGIDLDSNDSAVRIIDDCGRLIRIQFNRIDAVVEPQMRLRRCCDDRFECEEDEDDDECDEDEDECERHHRRHHRH